MAMVDGTTLDLIDAHTHTQPTSAATTAFMANLGRPVERAGTPTELLAGMDRVGIAWTMIVPWLPAQDFVAELVAGGVAEDTARSAIIDRWHELNSWAADQAHQQPDRLKSVIGLDPVLMSADFIEAEVSTQLAAGASGLKIAPMFIGVPADHEAMEIVYRLAIAHDVPVLAESGARAYRGHDAFGHPKYYRAVLTSFPRLRIQLAHLGMGAENEMAAVTKLSDNVITDTAQRFGGMPGVPDPTPAEMAAVIRQIGADHVAFGTNYPIVDQERYAATLRALDLNADERRRIGYDNAARIWEPPKVSR
jgi:predicted TIM-barrel fold metal-dependent hydrolase